MVHLTLGVDIDHFENHCSKVRNCAEPPDRLRSEISFSRTCNIQNLILCVYRLKRFTGCVSMVAQMRASLKQKFAQRKFFLDGTLMWTLP